MKVETCFVTITLTNRTYEYLIIEKNNQLYFSPFGLHGPYGHLKNDYDSYIEPHARMKFKKKGMPFQILGNHKAEMDHLLIKYFRDMLGLTDATAYAVCVPSFLNGRRTNDIPEQPFYLFDFRQDWNQINQGKVLELTLLELIRSRFADSWTWPLGELRKSDDDVELAGKAILDGYEEAMDLEVRAIHVKFVEQNKLNELNGESYLALLNEVLLKARQTDLTSFKDHMTKYDQPKKYTLISKNFAIRKATEGLETHLKIAQNFKSLIHPKKYKKMLVAQHEAFTKELVGV